MRINRYQLLKTAMQTSNIIKSSLTYQISIFNKHTTSPGTFAKQDQGIITLKTPIRSPLLPRLFD